MNTVLRCLDTVETMRAALSALEKPPNSKLKAKATAKLMAKALARATAGPDEVAPVIPCSTCPQANGERCGLGYPEAFTLEAIDCTIPTL